MPDDTRDPNDLARSDLFHQDESAARRLWERGFRPVHAEDFEPGELVVFRETDPLAGQPYGEPLVGMVERVERDELGGVRVQHSSGIVTEADDWSEVWAKRLPGEKPRMTETTETCPEDGEQPVVDGGPEGGPLLACGHEVERRGEAVVILGMVIDGAPYGAGRGGSGARAERAGAELAATEIPGGGRPAHR